MPPSRSRVGAARQPPPPRGQDSISCSVSLYRATEMLAKAEIDGRDATPSSHSRALCQPEGALHLPLASLVRQRQHRPVQARLNRRLRNQAWSHQLSPKPANGSSISRLFPRTIGVLLPNIASLFAAVYLMPRRMLSRVVPLSGNNGTKTSAPSCSSVPAQRTVAAPQGIPQKRVLASPASM